jgi:hypothetical protein
VAVGLRPAIHVVRSFHRLSICDHPAADYERRTSARAPRPPRHGGPARAGAARGGRCARAPPPARRRAFTHNPHATDTAVRFIFVYTVRVKNKARLTGQIGQTRRETAPGRRFSSRWPTPCSCWLARGSAVAVAEADVPRRRAKIFVYNNPFKKNYRPFLQIKP